MKPTTRMLLMADRSEPRRRDMPHPGEYPHMPWYGGEPSRGGYMGFGEHEEPESRRGRTRTGRYKRSRMGLDEYEDDDDWEEEEFEQRRGHGRVMAMPKKLDEHTAQEWMNGLENEDGTTGPHWTIDQTRQVAKQKGLQYDDLTIWVAMNMAYSDYCGVAKKLNVNNVDFYVCMAQAFLDDKDAVEDKLYAYYKHIVE